MTNPSTAPERGNFDAHLVFARAVITLSLFIATLGVSIPFGASSGQFTWDLNPLEWILSGLAFLSALGLLLDFIHPWRSWLYRVGVAEMAAGGVWAAIGSYELFLPGATTWPWRLGHALPAFGWMVLALTVWRWINVARTRQAPD